MTKLTKHCQCNFYYKKSNLILLYLLKKHYVQISISQESVVLTTKHALLNQSNMQSEYESEYGLSPGSAEPCLMPQ